MNLDPTAIAKPFACTQPGCEKAFVRASILRNHINATHNNLKLVCSACHKTFRYRNDLRQHVERVHEGKRPFVCKYEPRNDSGCACGRGYATRGELNRHQNKVKAKACSAVPLTVTVTVTATATPAVNPESLADTIVHAGSFVGCLGYRPRSLNSENDIAGQQMPCQPVYTDIRNSDTQLPMNTDDDTAPDYEGHGQPVTSTPGVLCRSMPLLGPLTCSEQLFLSIENYITGSFEAGIWVSHGQEFVCQSVKSIKRLRRHNIFNDATYIERALQREQYQFAKLYLSRACQNARGLVRGQNFSLVRDLLSLAVSYSGISRDAILDVVIQSLVLMLRHFVQMSLNLHGRHHPLSGILKMVCDAIRAGVDNCEEVLRAFRVIQTSYERMLGVDHRDSLEAKLELLKLSSAQPATVLQLFTYWERREGFGTPRVLLCLQYALSVQRAHHDYQGLQDLVQYVHSRLHHIKEEDVRWRYATLIWRRSAFAHMDEEQWSMAAETIQKRLLPKTVAGYGAFSPEVADELLLLKECLTEAGDWVQLQEVDDRLQYLYQRLEASDGGGSDKDAAVDDLLPE